MSTFLLVRHAAHDWLDRGLAGRLPGVALNARGVAQAQALVEQLAGVAIDAVYSSPQQRALETALPLAQRRGLGVGVDPAFDEIDFGRWMGASFEQLAAEPLWEGWVQRRSSATPPGGERFSGVSVRAQRGLARLLRRHPEQTVLLVSHGDVIKALLAACLGMSMDDLERFDIAPASVSVLAAQGDWAQVRALNWRPEAPAG